MNKSILKKLVSQVGNMMNLDDLDEEIENHSVKTITKQKRKPSQSERNREDRFFHNSNRVMGA